MTELSILEVYEFLRSNMYILARGQDRILSKKFNEDLESAKRSLPMRIVHYPEMGLKKNESFAVINWPDAFINFIMAANVPKTLESNGKVFDANKYSEPAMKEFQRMISKEGIDLEILTKSTMLYYASNKDFKKKIGNYILDGDWRTDYLELISVAELGEKALKDHINKEINGNHHNPWS